MTKLIITGSKGRMGQALIACAARNSGLEVAGQIDRDDDLRTNIDRGDVVIDFSSQGATPAIAAVCADHKKAIVIGTTGFTEEESSHIKKLGARVPIVLSANFSTGMNALFWLAGKAAEILGPGFDLEIVEMHHRLKRDAPSGSARKLAEILAQVRSQHLERVIRHGRSGMVGERKPEEIGMHSLRGGDVVGDHSVVFAGAGERVELTHKASTRETFANGALRAAQWVVSRPPGLYDMQDVLGLK